jgi:hypothetical protein
MTNLLLGLILSANLMGHDNAISFGLGIMLGITVIVLYMLQAVRMKAKTKKCNKCAEVILKGASTCKHCHSDA